MTAIPIVIIAAVVIMVIFFLMSKKAAARDREGVVKDVLNKDAFVVEFDDQKPTVVKFFGISAASENEMLDEKIFEFLNENILGQRVLVKSMRVDTGEVVVAEIRSLAGEYANALIVRQGFARWSPSEAPNDRELMEAQNQAKEDRLGVWNPAVRQLAEEKMKQAATGELDDSEVGDQQEEKEA
ncbi:MAG: thermonuclease family protein [Verrucomicrobiota bacterium]